VDTIDAADPGQSARQYAGATGTLAQRLIGAL
jgi:hypothetical protein